MSTFFAKSIVAAIDAPELFAPNITFRNIRSTCQSHMVKLPPCIKRLFAKSSKMNQQMYADSDRRSGFARGSSKNNNPQKPGNGGQSPTGFGQALSPSQSSLNPSPSPSPSAVIDNPMNQDIGNRGRPFFFREQYANLIVKGNFMTLAAKPVLVEEGEWLAHQGMLPHRRFSPLH